MFPYISFKIAFLAKSTPASESHSCPQGGAPDTLGTYVLGQRINVGQNVPVVVVHSRICYHGINY
jgi:hypothetical protein